METRGTHIPEIVRRLRRAAAAWPPTAVMRVAGRSRDPFQVLVSCLISLRTPDRVTEAASARLFTLAQTPQSVRALSRPVIEQAIYPAAFYRVKARTLHALCDALLTAHGGRVPDDLGQLLTLPGVGRKTANLVVTVAYGKPGVCVDTHVHRISNRLGLVATRTPEQTEMALRQLLPRRYWIAYNDLLVTFGQHLCRPLSPHCSTCPVYALCARRGVERHR